MHNEIITSAANPQVKQLQLLMKKGAERKTNKQYVVEGIKMVKEIPFKSLVHIYFSESFIKNNSNYHKEFNVMDGICTVLSDKIFSQVTDTVTPQGVMAIAAMKENSIKDIVELKSTEGRDKRIYLILDDIRDPGNLGTIVRTSEAAGVTGIILSKNSVDIYSPKVIRSTMGSVFRVPFTYVEKLTEAIDMLKAAGVKTYAAHLQGEVYSKRDIFSGDVALMIGNEANGLSEPVAQRADVLIKIPMYGKVESLNAAIATAVLLYNV